MLEKSEISYSIISLSHRILLLPSSSCTFIPCDVVGSEDSNLSYYGDLRPLSWLSSYNMKNGYTATMIATGGYDFAGRSLGYVYQRPALLCVIKRKSVHFDAHHYAEYDTEEFILC